jgi:hypothetical protein
MKKVSFAIFMLASVSCSNVIASPAGPFRVVAFNSNGEKLPENVDLFGTVFKESPLVAQDKTAIPKLVKYLCTQYPDATIKIVDFNTQNELDGIGPSSCK